jgi:hypothetical protein
MQQRGFAGLYLARVAGVVQASRQTTVKCLQGVVSCACGAAFLHLAHVNASSLALADSCTALLGSLRLQPVMHWCMYCTYYTHACTLASAVLRSCPSPCHIAVPTAISAAPQTYGGAPGGHGSHTALWQLPANYLGRPPEASCGAQAVTGRANDCGSGTMPTACRGVHPYLPLHVPPSAACRAVMPNVLCLHMKAYCMVSRALGVCAGPRRGRGPVLPHVHV